MDYSHAHVQLSDISLNDHYFRITCGADLEELSRSLAHCGLINAPIVIERNGGMTIVSGFGRIAAAHRLGWPEIPVKILQADTSLEACIQIAIVDNTSQRTLNICEQIRAISLLEGIAGDLEGLTHWAQSCGLAVNPKVVADLRKVAQLPASLDSGLISGAIALPVAVRLAGMQDRLAAEMLGSLLLELDLSLNRQRETLDWIEAIARREDLEIQHILESEALVRVRKAQSDRRQRGALIRHYLKNRRYPAIAAAESEFESLVRKLQLPKSIQLIAPPGFESRFYCIQLQVAGMQDLSDLQHELSRMVECPDLKSLFENRNS
jgi:ParB family transcriptional regulator, chromosome partitioning protein